MTPKADTQQKTAVLDPVKAKHRAMWALGDYDRVAVEVIAELGHALVSAAGVGTGMRVLDVAAGSGNASIPAALAGAEVVATDLTPELIQIGEQRCAARDLPITWRQADAEYLPFGDDEFDVTLSCVGVMFAPFHRPVADELVRVTRPGGTIALANWTPEGFIGRLFATMKPFVSASPAGATPPPLWGNESHVRSLLGDSTTALTCSRQHLAVTRFASGESFRDFFATFYGPTIAAYRAVADDADRTAALDRALTELGEQRGAGSGRAMEWEYLLVTARVA